MNERRIHELMRSHFPAADVSQEWTNVADRNGALQDRIQRLVDENINSSELLVEVHRKLGMHLPKNEAIAFICEHVLKGRIKIADRSFSGFVLMEVNGVAKGWRVPSLTETLFMSDPCP